MSWCGKDNILGLLINIIIYVNLKQEGGFMKTESVEMEFNLIQWEGVGFGHEWHSEKTELDEAIKKGVQDSLQAFEDSQKTNQVIIGYRPD